MLPSLPGITLSQSSSATTTSHHRGKKGIIQLDESGETTGLEEEDPEDLHSLLAEEPLSPPSLNRRPATRNTSEAPVLPPTPIKARTTRTPLPSLSPPHPRFRTVVEQIVSHPVVTFFSCGNPASAKKSLQRAIHTQAPLAILKTMKQFPYASRLQKMGCGALRDLAVDSWPLKASMVDEGAVPILLKSMRIHDKDAALQLLACKALYELVTVPPLSEDRSIVIALLQTIDHHDQDEDVLLVALQVLMALTDQGPGAIESLRHQLGGVVLAKLEHGFRGRNDEIYQKSGNLLKRLYL